MDSYCEKTFLNDFIILFNEDDEYDFTILFDDYFSDYISRISSEFLKSIYKYYDIDENDEEKLYDHLYLLVERMICDKCESDADTDIE